MSSPAPGRTPHRTRAPLLIEVGGVLTERGPRLGPHLLTARPDGTWRIDPNPGPSGSAGPDVRFGELIAAPALYDAHVHLHPDLPLADYLAYGVARIRDLGSRAEDAPHPARDPAEPVPDVVLGGPMLDRPGRPRLLIASVWDDPAQLPGLLDAAVGRGASWIKLYEGFPTELFPATVRQAHERGLRVAVHPGPGVYRAALAAGVDELQHLACLTPSGPPGTHALLARWAGRGGADRGGAGRGGEDGWPRLPAGTAVCPTLLVQHSLVREAGQGWAFTGHDPRMVDFWRGSAIAARPWSRVELAAGQRAEAAMRQVVGELDRAGVRWVVGSDTPNPGLVPGRSLWQEMNLLVDAGLDPLAVYRAASVAAGLGTTGDEPLVFLPPTVFDPGPFPVHRPAGTLLRGCLFRPEPTADPTAGPDR